MTYLTKQYTKFFKDLAKNNNREWFNENKKRYEQDVKDPFHQLTAKVIKRIHKLDPEVDLEVKDAVFRIYRDVRFSKDKSPYKLHMAAVVSRGGRKDHTEPGIYYMISGDQVTIGGGCWQPDSKKLYSIRNKMVSEPKAVKKLLQDKKFKEVFGEVDGDKNKIIPKEFREAAEDLPLIYNKSFHFMADYKINPILDSDLAKMIVDHYKVGSKWNDFLRAAMKA